MRKAIVYASVHHGNTEKLVKNIAEECQVNLIDAVKQPDADLSSYDIIIGFNWVNFRFMSFIIVKNEITLVYNKYRTSKNKMCISQFEEFKDAIVEFKLGRS